MSAKEKIEGQQKRVKERSAVWMVGEQLKDMLRMEPELEELLDRDLDVPEMSIAAAEKKIKAFADAHKQGGFSCVTPAEAEKILRNFYGLGERTEDGEIGAARAPRPRRAEGQGPGRGVIDLSAFF